MQLGTREVATEGQRRLYSDAELFLETYMGYMCNDHFVFIRTIFTLFGKINTLVWLLLFSLIPHAYTCSGYFRKRSLLTTRH